MATHGGRHTRSKRRQLESFLKTPESEILTRVEIARKFGCSLAYVSRVASLMGKARPYLKSRKNVRPDLLVSIGKENSGQPPKLNKSVEALRATVTERDIAAIKDSNTLSTQEQREHLSWLALNASRDEARVAAHRALQQLDQSLGVQTKLGPGEPLTKEGKIFRLALLMEACGRSVVEEAMRRAFNPREGLEREVSSASFPVGDLSPETQTQDPFLQADLPSTAEDPAVQVVDLPKWVKLPKLQEGPKGVPDVEEVLSPEVELTLRAGVDAGD